MKEFGLLSWGMMKYQGYDSFLATYDNGDYTNLQYLPGLRIEFIPRISGSFHRDALTLIRKNAKRIDVIMTLHMNRLAFSKFFIYKLFNPKGKIYLKSDGWPMPYHKSILMHPTSYILTKMCDCISTELQDKAEDMSRAWHRNIVHVPNPANPNDIQSFRLFSERSNTILTVGRLGTRQKATEILLEAFAQIAAQIPGWTLKLAGYFSENMNIASDFYAAHPELKDRVIFTGEIRDRQTLIDMYRDAKIFAFPSRWESFGIALTEAMMQGCFAVTTDIPASRTLTENFRYALGSPVDDIDGLAKNLFYACTHESEIESLAQEGREATLKRCDLKHCCEVIAEGLK